MCLFAFRKTQTCVKMAPIITHSLSLFNVNPIIKKSDASPIAPSNDQLVHCERSAAVDYIKSQWESVTSRAHHTINESGILVLVEAQPSTLENQTAEASIQKIESSYLSELDDQTIAPVAHQLVQISTVNKQDISSLFIIHSSARPYSIHDQNEFDRTTTDSALLVLGNNQPSQSVELINKNAASGIPTASNDTEQQQADNNNFTLINANILVNKRDLSVCLAIFNTYSRKQFRGKGKWRNCRKFFVKKACVTKLNLAGLILL